MIEIPLYAKKKKKKREIKWLIYLFIFTEGKTGYKPSNKKIGYLWGSIMKVKGTKKAMAFL